MLVKGATVGTVVTMFDSLFPQQRIKLILQIDILGTYPETIYNWMSPHQWKVNIGSGLNQC